MDHFGSYIQHSHRSGEMFTEKLVDNIKSAAQGKVFYPLTRLYTSGLNHKHKYQSERNPQELNLDGAEKEHSSSFKEARKELVKMGGAEIALKLPEW
jgi:hypothetical protein